MLISTGFPSLSYSYNLLRLSVCFPIQLILLHGGTTIYKRLLDIQSLSLPGGPRDPMVGCICVVLARRIWREPGVYSPMIAYAAACCCLPAAPCCCLLLVLLLVAAAAVVLLQSNSLQSKKQTARHPFRNTSETAKHHLISCPKRSKGTPKKGLTSLLKPYLKLQLCRCLPLPAAACCCLLLPLLLLLPAAACCWCLLLPAAACCCLQLPAAACGCLPAAPCCCLLLVLLLVAAAAAAVVLLQSNSLQSKKQTARHPFRNTSETAKHHLISYPKRSKGTPKKGLTSLLKPYLKLQLCRCLPLPAAASAGVCCCLLLPAAACCYLLLPAAACCCLPAAPCCWCCCCWWLLLLLWCCCNQTASKARNKQPDTLFETHPKQQNTT